MPAASRPTLDSSRPRGVEAEHEPRTPRLGKASAEHGLAGGTGEPDTELGRARVAPVEEREPVAELRLETPPGRRGFGCRPIVVASAGLRSPWLFVTLRPGPPATLSIPRAVQPVRQPSHPAYNPDACRPRFVRPGFVWPVRMVARKKAPAVGAGCGAPQHDVFAKLHGHHAARLPRRARPVDQSCAPVRQRRLHRSVAHPDNGAVHRIETVALQPRAADSGLVPTVLVGPVRSVGEEHGDSERHDIDGQIPVRVRQLAPPLSGQDRPQTLGDRTAAGVSGDLRKILRCPLQCPQRHVGQGAAVLDSPPTWRPHIELQTEDLAQRTQPRHRGHVAAAHVPKQLRCALRPDRGRPRGNPQPPQRCVDRS